MTRNPIRRAQLVAPFGVGAMMVVKDGTSLISAGIDHWYEYEGKKQKRSIDTDEFRVEEWRLQRLLHVNHFRLPPDYRDMEGDFTNKYIRVPFLRFPQWHFCPGCKCLYKYPLTLREKPKCPTCAEKGKKRYLAQVPFVAMCEKGHIQDFPWVEWVHKSITPQCRGQIRIVATGSSSLGAQIVKCECGKERSLSQVTTESFLTQQLDQEGRSYICHGHVPWLGTEEGTQCGNSLRGSLRSASNLYYADVRSAIYLPRGNDLAELVTLMETPTLSTHINLLRGLIEGNIHKLEPKLLRSSHKELLLPFSDEQIKRALQIILSSNTSEGKEKEINVPEESETSFRREEFEVLKRPRQEEALVIKESNIDDYNMLFNKYFSRIMLISKLRETRALAGFTRILPENKQSIEERKALLRRTTPGKEDDNWIPAYVVYGEGIFIEFNEQTLQLWESSMAVSQRVFPLVRHYQQLEKNLKIRARSIGPRFILLHTFSHLLINRLVFECGYSAAALRERLYISDDRKAPMAGILLYTAAGDSEGTMGGLVRMGQVGKLEPVIHRALVEAQWCSADPVCMETGLESGQGADFYNLAACHNCALIPETACEEFNRFLDRALVIGKIDDRKLGYFDFDNW